MDPNLLPSTSSNCNVVIGLDDAILRAEKYINAGADGIMIHSKKTDPSEIFEFCKIYQKLNNKVYKAKK